MACLAVYYEGAAFAKAAARHYHARVPFTFEQAEALIPRVKELTASAATTVERMLGSVSGLPESDPKKAEVGERIREIVEAWANDIMALGAEVKGLWLVDFDSGEGYWCWRHPEETLEYFHGYEEGFAGRRLVRPPVLH
jgi:hypothetical protein